MLGVGATNAVGSNHWSTVGLSRRPSPMRSGHEGAPLLTPVLRNTVNGRPVESVTIPENCQFSRIGLRIPLLAMARPSPNGSDHTQLATKRCLTSKPEGPRLSSKSVTLCGPPTAPPPEAGEPA